MLLEKKVEKKLSELLVVVFCDELDLVMELLVIILVLRLPPYKVEPIGSKTWAWVVSCLS